MLKQLWDAWAGAACMLLVAQSSPHKQEVILGRLPGLQAHRALHKLVLAQLCKGEVQFLAHFAQLFGGEEVLPCQHCPPGCRLRV